MTDASERSFENALSRMPVFPLPQVVFFPGAVLPLHVFEPRYRAMLKDCLATHGAMAVAQLLPGDDEQGRPRFAEIAGGGIVAEYHPLGDGRANIVLVGKARLRLRELEPDEPLLYRVARATVIEEKTVAVPEHDRTALVAAATMFAAEVKKHDTYFRFTLPKSVEAGALADLCAFQLVVDASARQAALEESDPRARVAMVLDQLALQHGAMMKTDGDDRVLN